MSDNIKFKPLPNPARSAIMENIREVNPKDRQLVLLENLQQFFSTTDVWIRFNKPENCLQIKVGRGSPSKDEYYTLEKDF